MVNSTVRKEGFVAAGQGVKVGDNPYSEHDNLHWEWMNGWVNYFNV